MTTETRFEASSSRMNENFYTTETNLIQSFLGYLMLFYQPP